MATITEARISTNEAKEARQRKIKALVKARGFDPAGSWAFRPYPSTRCEDNDIAYGTVDGSFIINPGKVRISMSDLRSDSKHWTYFLTLFDPVFEYTNNEQVESLEFDISSVKVNVSIKCPTKGTGVG